MGLSVAAAIILFLVFAIFILIAIWFLYVTFSSPAATQALAGNAKPGAHPVAGSKRQPQAVVRLYWADWCGWSKRFQPEWNKLKELMKDNANVSFEDYKDFDPRCRSAVVDNGPVRGYPTVSISVKGSPEYTLRKGTDDADALSAKINAILHSTHQK